jgi:uncharacterized protein (DUF58 family)
MPLVVTPAILAAWWLVAHDSGAGWMQALGDVVFGMLAIGIIGPAVVLWRTKLFVVRTPVDAVAGQEADVFIDASSRVRVRGVEPAATEAFLGPVGRKGRRSDQLTLIPEHRGAYDHLVCDVATAAPFGLQWWTKRVELPLATPLLVAPRSGAVSVPQRRASNAEGEETERTRPDSGQPRGARPYKAGDSRRLVHWQASAHTGELMVRELEGPSTTPITVEVVLPRDQDEAERIAERAFATVAKLLEQGASVRLGTLERSGTVLGAVGDRRSAGRRLARAIAEPEASSRATGVVVAS